MNNSIFTRPPTEYWGGQEVAEPLNSKTGPQTYLIKSTVKRIFL